MFAGLCAGVFLGLVLQRSHYCTMGALSDFFLFGSWRRLRVWILAVSLGVIGTQWQLSAGLIDLANTHYIATSIQPTNLLLGGVLFGWGMVLAGGCASRNLVRTGQGSLKALVVVLVMVITAAAVSSGALSRLRDFASLGLAIEALPTVLPSAVGMVVAALGGGFCLYRQAIQRQWSEALTGGLLGMLVALSWWWSMQFVGQLPPAPAALDLISPSTDLLLWLSIDKIPGFGAALIAGTVLGAFSAAMMADKVRLETFSDQADMMRHLVGGCLMGIGGALAYGDTFGQGMSGLASLSIGSTIAVLGIVLGTRGGLAQLEAGGFLILLKVLYRSRNWRAAGR